MLAIGEVDVHMLEAGRHLARSKLQTKLPAISNISPEASHTLKVTARFKSNRDNGEEGGLFRKLVLSQATYCIKAERSLGLARGIEHPQHPSEVLSYLKG